MRESYVERALVRQVEALGGRCLKLTAVKGLPDRLVLLPGGRTAFVETKAPVGRVSRIQWWWIDKLRYLGFPVRIIYSPADAVQAVQELAGGSSD